jgi:hypothetical protein
VLVYLYEIIPDKGFPTSDTDPESPHIRSLVNDLLPLIRGNCVNSIVGSDKAMFAGDIAPAGDLDGKRDWNTRSSGLFMQLPAELGIVAFQRAGAIHSNYLYCLYFAQFPD